MTPRERVQCILDGGKPDRVAIDIGSTASSLTNRTFFRVKDYFGITSDDIVTRPDESSSFYNDELIEKLGGDFKHLFLMPPDGFTCDFEKTGKIVSEFGIEKTLVDGLMQFSNAPLADAEYSDIDKYQFPDPYDKSRVRGVRERAKYLYHNTDYAIATRAVSHGFYELAWELRGMENFLVDMMVDKEFAGKLMDKTLEIQMGFYDALLTECGEFVQIVETGDDYGTQTGPIMSPELFREMIVPRRKKLNDFIRSKAPNAKIFLHTCGSIYLILEDILSTGVDVLNPVQPSAAGMDTLRLAEEFKGRVVFHGGIDEQTALICDGERLEEEMKTRVQSLGKYHSYIMSPCSNFQDDMPLENIVDFASIAKKVGVYK